MPLTIWGTGTLHIACGNVLEDAGLLTKRLWWIWCFVTPEVLQLSLDWLGMLLLREEVHATHLKDERLHWGDSSHQTALTASYMTHSVKPPDEQQLGDSDKANPNYCPTNWEHIQWLDAPVAAWYAVITCVNVPQSLTLRIKSNFKS